MKDGINRPACETRNECRPGQKSAFGPQKLFRYGASPFSNQPTDIVCHVTETEQSQERGAFSAASGPVSHAR